MEEVFRHSFMLVFIVLAGATALVTADTPANCLYEDIRGTWTFSETERTGDHTINCDELGPIVHAKNFTLSFPNTATDELGNEGTWTLIYNQGFEVNINERSYFAFSYYEGDLNAVVSYCDRTFNGWSRDKTIRNWSCYTAQKTTPVNPRVDARPAQRELDRPFRNDQSFIDKINAAQSSWTAKAYPEFTKYTVKEMQRRAGGPKPAISSRPRPAPATAEQKAQTALLPEHFDWRDVEGENYVSPVRDQGGCGSCYAFASMANLEAQVRIATRNQRQDVFSPQDIVSCSELSQGCNGGFDFLIAGRHAQDQGVVAEECNKYVGSDTSCATDNSCSRTYVSDYQHVGGYYGACNEEVMLEALVTTGPISVSFEVYSDFSSYNGGIYHHTGLESDFNPFELTNHVVLIVGYGVEEDTGEKFWIVKNSWGGSWGEDGFFRIRRGTDECAIESMAVQVTIIP
ncbi:dipeptidyl peptidase 1-like isoform X2 [Homarus americanus]|uniref:dipeptidyl peptidase 1-like isoform X2 n=1 Tax=Homarus americanus TaxID=6706 RepID=UPI001C44735E|nr:dipeptidyl peptidase 1-like isoform X2 [Homarus americanus]